MIGLRRLAGGLAGVLLAWASPVLAQTEVANPADPWVHRATETPFPERVAGFERGRVVEYSADGRDASVGYNLRRGDSWGVVTLYIYPAAAGVSCEASFADVKGNVQSRPGAELVRDVRTPAPLGRGAPVAYHAAYRLPAGSMSANSPAVRSDAYLHCPAGGQWLVKYRATWTDTADFSGEVDALLHAIAWPATLGN